MADIFGASMKKQQILEHVGDISQICDAQKKTYSDGKSSGVETVDVTTGSGFSFTILPSRGLDISHAVYKGTPISWKSVCGEVAPQYFEPEGLNWLRNFFGGLLTTCGMTYSSHPCEDNGEQLGLHGRVSNIPADNVNITKQWDNDDYLMIVTGRVREVKVFGEKLELSRKITTSLGSSKLVIRDTVENIGFNDSPLMMLYHVNIGWPLVSEHSRLISPTTGVRPADDRARSEIDTWSSFTSPQKDYRERVYFHDQKADKDGKITVALVNEAIELGVYLSFLKSEFPHFIEWKMMGQGEYVIGIEPGNITGHRAYMRKEGTLEFIKPGTKRDFTLEIGILDSNESIQKTIQEINEVKV
ncbi:MAG: aldose 1-epimerase family protein [Candidatus Latescibacteria bacterium]|nr:aldose 1-epimerase family protein [Candidatus Latescibacterota bacterium]